MANLNTPSTEIRELSLNEMDKLSGGNPFVVAVVVVGLGIDALIAYGIYKAVTGGSSTTAAK